MNQDDSVMSVIKLNLKLDYSDAYIHVKRTVTITEARRDDATKRANEIKK